MTNVPLQDWDTPFGLPPFDRIRDEDFAPAFETALAEARAAIAAIATDPAPPDFDNTIATLERVERRLSQVMAPFHAVADADSTPLREELERDFALLFAAYSSDIIENKALFARIDALWQGRETLGLTAEQDRVLMLTRRGFVRAGAMLEGASAARIREIRARSAVLMTAFPQNLLADERDWAMDLAEGELEGLPDFLVAALHAAGAERGRDGAVVTTSRSLMMPFLQFSPRRDLRERAHAAFVRRGANGGATDNRAIAAETLALRAERARLLGYPDYAAFALETEMAGNAEAVRDLLMRVWAPARARAEADAAVLEAMLVADGLHAPLQPWDWSYCAEKRRRAEHDLDAAALKPFFQLDRMIAAAFDCAGRLFGLGFREIAVPLYHLDARAWEVTRDGAHLAVFIGDFLARPSKASGAWCSAIRVQARMDGEVWPHVVNVCNFARPEDGQPALLSWDDARTLFHEFGHALHKMLSDVTYPSISGTTVAGDFGELPSQLYEHWLEVPEVLDRFATHAATGEAMPADLRDRLLAAATYDMGFKTVEYLASALVDLDFHEGEPPADPMQRQAEVLERLGMPQAIRMRHATPHFAHVFAGDGYAAGYYSYMWSEVMDADAFAAFEEAGDAFDPALAARLERDILSRGGSEDAAVLYTRFRGRLPGVEALLKGRGLLGAA